MLAIWVTRRSPTETSTDDTPSSFNPLADPMASTTPNPYEAPKSGGLKSSHLSLSVWLGVSVLFFVLAGRQFVAGNELRVRIIESGRSLESVPPTMLSQHPATGVALVCIGLICILFAFRSTQLGIWWGQRPANKARPQSKSPSP